MALYATLLFERAGTTTVLVNYPGGQMIFNVNPNNKLLYQERELTNVAGAYQIEAQGTTCAAVQVCGDSTSQFLSWTLQQSHIK